MSDISPWQAYAALADSFEDFDDLDLAILESDPAFSLRQDQLNFDQDFRYLGYIAGRGLGKTHAVAKIITEEVNAGRISRLALMAHTEEATMKVQVNEGLIAHCSPWNKCSMFLDELVWENGARATIYTPGTPGGPRGFNGDAAWLTELVAWPEHTRQEAFNNVLTAVRVGGARIFWDTTSRGKNELVSYMMQLNELDPKKYPILRGTMFENPILGKDYLREACIRYTGREYEEEVLGKVFEEAAGALFEQAWFDAHRVNVSPTSLDLKVIGLDPGVSEKGGVDGCGIVIGGRDARGNISILKDRSGIYLPEQYSNIVFEEHAAGSAGVVCETNKGGATHEALLRAHGQMRGIDLRVLGVRDPTPRWSRHVLYFKPVFSRNDKLTRGMGPSSLAANGRIHMVGKFPELERQLCTYAGEGRSPNNFDAFNQVVHELGELFKEGAPREGREQRAIATRNADAQLQARLTAIKKARSVV